MQGMPVVVTIATIGGSLNCTKTKVGNNTSYQILDCNCMQSGQWSNFWCCFYREMCLRFCEMERKLGEIDRARAIYMHGSQMADPRVSVV